VRVEVKDTGIGFPVDMAERIFQRFVQVDMAGTRKFGAPASGWRSPKSWSSFTVARSGRRARSARERPSTYVS